VAPVEDVTEQPSDPAPEGEEGEAPLPALPPGDLTSIAFEPLSSKLPAGAEQALNGVADQILSRPGAPATLIAYAEGEDKADGRARRLSLARALAVRGYLISRGVVSTRLEIQARGAAYEEGSAPDRVDLVVGR
jgi:outer membrane protein OmpA-like peptidoglycan-associated protein